MTLVQSFTLICPISNGEVVTCYASIVRENQSLTSKQSALDAVDPAEIRWHVRHSR